MEIWKDIKNYEGLYQVSNHGRVKRLENVVTYSNGIKATHKERILKPDNLKGYFRYTLSKNNKQKRFFGHRLVAVHFLNNKENKPCVNHIDGNPSNNHYTNLEWCTYSENERHSYDVLNKINANRKLTNKDVKNIRNNYDLGDLKYLAYKHNVSETTIRNVLNYKYYV